jgi:preprotein translocase subunit SecA
MSLYEEWKQLAESPTTPADYEKFWKEYYDLEKQVYQKLLADHETVVEGTLSELAEKFDMNEVLFTGFMDGIDTSLKKECGVEKLKPASKVRLDIDFEKLFFNMQEAKAKWLYELPEWDGVLSEKKRNDIRKEWRASKQAVSEKKVGRNDPCPCGSGKKYKKCCGK